MSNMSAVQQLNQEDQTLKLAIMTAIRINLSSSTDEYVGAVALQKGFSNQDAVGAVNILNEVSTKLNIQGCFTFENEQIIFHGQSQFNRHSLISTLDAMKHLSKLNNVSHVQQPASSKLDGFNFTEWLKNQKSQKLSPLTKS